MMFHAKEQRRNVRAEGAAVRKNFWGSNESQATDEDDMSGNIVMGDQHTHVPAPQQGKLSTALAMLATGAAIAGIPGGAAIGYLAGQLNKSPAVETQKEDVSLRLLQIEDLEGTNSNDEKNNDSDIR